MQRLIGPNYGTLTIVTINAVLLVVVLLVAWFYAHDLIIRDDAARLLAPGYADSIFQHAWKHYNALEGRLTVILYWDFFQFLTRIIHPQELSQIPVWLLIGFSQFSFLAAPFNAALLARKIFNLTFSGTALAIFFVFALWGANSNLFAYTLNPGNGPYALFTWLFSISTLIYMTASGRQRIMIAYPLLALSFAGSDLLFVPTLLFIAAIEIVNVFETKSSRYDAARRFGVVLLIAGAVTAVILASPGFQARRAVFNSVGAGSLFNTFGWSNFASYYDRLLSNTYFPLTQGTPFEWLAQSGHFVHFLVVVFCVFVIWLDIRKARESGDKPIGAMIVVLALLAFHLTHIRALISAYHGTYGNDGPIFIFLLLVMFSTVVLAGRIVLQPVAWRSIKIGTGLGLTVFILWPNVADSVFAVRTEQHDSALCTEYAEKASALMKAGLPSSNGAWELNIIGSPRWNMASCVTGILRWRGVTNVKIGEVGTTSFIDSPSALVLEATAKTPPVPPGWAPSFNKMPRLLGSRFDRDKYSRDFLISADTIQLSVMVELNSNLEASPYIVNRYKYDIILMSDPSGYGARRTLISKAESSYVGTNSDPLEVVMVSEGNEVEYIDKNAPRILRMKVRGGNQKYIYTSSSIAILDTK